MPSFNAEIAVKALEKRVDRMETLLGSIEKQVKVLVDTRGASKEKAVDELAKLLPAMHAADEKLRVELRALTLQAQKDRDSVEKLGSVAQAAMDKEIMAARKEQDAEMKRLDAEIKTRFQETTELSRLLLRQHTEAVSKREATVAKEIGAMQDKLVEAAKASSLAAALDARFTRLETLVQAALRKG